MKLKADNSIISECHNDRQDRGQRTKDKGQRIWLKSASRDPAFILCPLSFVLCPLSFVLQDYYGMNIQLPISNWALATLGIGNIFTLATLYPALRSRRGRDPPTITLFAIWRPIGRGEQTARMRDNGNDYEDSNDGGKLDRTRSSRHRWHCRPLLTTNKNPAN